MSTAKIIARCQALYDDLDFTSAREWKNADPKRKVIGYMPVYVPREIIHAAGMLPLGILGGGDQMEVIHGDAYYQRYLPHTTLDDRTRSDQEAGFCRRHAVPEHLRCDQKFIRNVATDVPRHLCPLL